MAWKLYKCQTRTFFVPWKTVCASGAGFYQKTSLELDAALEPILLQQKFKESGQDMIKLGDSNVPYNNSFKFFISTKLPNPHYAPEVCVKVTLLNFTITMSGLEEQLLGVVVKEEMPELAERKAALIIVENAACNEQLFTIESTQGHEGQLETRNRPRGT